MISTLSRSSRFRTSRQGFSLIEVAIALVIFVIGALAIIRIFPGALSVIGNNGDQQIATNLNRTALARLKSENAVPYANFNIAVNNDGTLQWRTADNTNHTADFVNAGNPTNGDIDASVIGVPRFNNSLPTTEDINTGVNNSALSRFRGIQGEQAQVITFTGSTDQYILTQFPLSLAKVNGGTTDTLLAPTISQEYTIGNARIDKQGNITFKDATIIDVNGKTIRLDAATDARDVAKNTVTANSTIYVSYRYYNSAGKVWDINDEALPITTAIASPNTPGKLTDATLTVNPPTTTRGAGVAYNMSNPNTTGAVAEIIDVRVKRFVSVGAFGTPSDPAPGTTGYPNLVQVGDARRGLVRLNTTVTTDTVTVDYIADWSFLLQDGVPSIAANATYPALPPMPPAPLNLTYRQLALGAPFIEDRVPVSVYSLLIESGDVYKSGYGTVQPDPPSINRMVRANDPQQREDELRSGKVTFIVENSASRARVAYQTRANWVQQLAVAANAYKPYALRAVAGAASTVTEPWRDYYLGDDNYLYFHAGEAGKTISISYRTTDDNGPLVERPFVISDEIINTPTGSPANVPASFNSSGRVARVKLTDAQGRKLPDNPNPPLVATDPPQLVSIQAIKGTSVTMRTAYINGTKYTQALLTTNRGASS